MKWNPNLDIDSEDVYLSNIGSKKKVRIYNVNGDQVFVNNTYKRSIYNFSLWEFRRYHDLVMRKIT
jgi:hypothetical protein